MKRAKRGSGEVPSKKKLKELGPDVNADAELPAPSGMARRGAGKVDEDDKDPELPAPSGKLYRRSGERAAKQYIPVETHNGEFLILAAQGEKDYDKMYKIGKSLTDGFFRTPMAAKKALFRVFSEGGRPDPSSAFYTKIVHLNPTDSGVLSRSSGELATRDDEEKERSSDSRPEARPSGRAQLDGSAIARGEADGDRAVPALRKQLRSYGRDASIQNPSIRRAIMSQISRLSTEGADNRGLRGRERDAYTQAFESKATTRILETLSSGAASLGSDGESLRRRLEKIGTELRRYAVRAEDDLSERDQWAMEHVRRFATRDLSFRLAKGQLEHALQSVKNLPSEIENLGSSRIANDIRRVIGRLGVAPSGALSKGVRTGLLVAGLGAAVIGVTAIAQKVAKDQASRRA